MEIEFISTLWGIWIHINEIIFKNIKLDPGRIVEIIKETSCRYKDSIRNLKRKMGDNDNNKEEEKTKRSEWTVG